MRRTSCSNPHPYPILKRRYSRGASAPVYVYGYVCDQGGGRKTLMSRLRVPAPASERLSPEVLRLTTAGRMACSAGQLVASKVNRHCRRERRAEDLE
jgi:hypothetical protein